jgi:predicted esterase YcpF (UPF0227 family)
MILYLHGFRSSPDSFKARLFARRMDELGRTDAWLCPQLPASSAAAVALAQSLVEGVAAAELSIVGSSLGGFYATHLAERLGCRAVLLNPAVHPRRALAQYVTVAEDGARLRTLTQYHSDAPFEFRAAYVDELRALEVARITRPERYYLIAATGDELLDWREMVAHYPGARHTVIEGSDHGIGDFAAYLDGVLDFCGVHP